MDVYGLELTAAERIAEHRGDPSFLTLLECGHPMRPTERLRHGNEVWCFDCACWQPNPREAV